MLRTRRADAGHLARHCRDAAVQRLNQHHCYKGGGIRSSQGGAGGRVDPTRRTQGERASLCSSSVLQRIMGRPDAGTALRRCCITARGGRRWAPLFAGAASHHGEAGGGHRLSLMLHRSTGRPNGGAGRPEGGAARRRELSMRRWSFVVPRGAAMELRRVPIGVALELCRAARCCHGASMELRRMSLVLLWRSSTLGAAMELRRRLPVLRCSSHRRLSELRCITRCCIGALAGDAGVARSPERAPRRVMHHRCLLQREAL